MIRFGHIAILTVCLLALCANAFAVERFPPPDFETGYEFPETTTPPPRSDFREYTDVVVLLAALALATWLTYTKRSRRGLFMLMIFSAIYFGFYRKGCICPIGAIQNVVLTIFDSDYAIPLTAIAFFLLPLVFALFVGRVFCAAVCPLGALQDVVLLRPISVAGWLESVLRLFAWGYLAAAVLFAATGSAFVICRYDPFIAFFRLGGNLNIVIIGVCILIVGVFVGRPYCRFICPYGLILRQLSRLSKRRVMITPDDCIKCRLCEDACPFGAIQTPTAPWPASSHAAARKKLGILILLQPVLVVVSGWAGFGLSGRAARVHDRVRLADRIHMEDAGLITETTETIDAIHATNAANASDAFRASGETTEKLFADAHRIRGHFALGGWLAGGFMGLIAGLKLILAAVRPNRTEYQADTASCLACGRCYRYCPREHARLGKFKQEVD